MVKDFIALEKAWLSPFVAILCVFIFLGYTASIPGTDWIAVNRIKIEDSVVGSPIGMVVSREIKKDFLGSWNVTIRRWEDGGMVVWCSASNQTAYKVGSRLPKDLNLSWWTGNQCYPLPAGKYFVTTTWEIRPVWSLFVKQVTEDSNVFEVRDK